MEKVKRISRLKTSGRITPREVLKAYEATGLETMFGGWQGAAEDGAMACGLTALAASVGVDIGPTPKDPARAVTRYLSERVRDALNYRLGFTAGFDDSFRPAQHSPLRTGWRDGKRARAFVKARL